MDTTIPAQDIMQVCRNGHVITDRLRRCPEQAAGHCDRCGAVTYDRCLTCGQELPGASFLAGHVPIGTPPPPNFCGRCGAAFPWTTRPVSPATDTPLARLDSLLRRLPEVARQLRRRHDQRPSLLLDDRLDLQDLVRSLLPLFSEQVYLESRTPLYAAQTQLDFLLKPEGLALTVKLAGKGWSEARFLAELAEDAAYYQRRAVCPTLAVFVYDQQGLIRDRSGRESAWTGRQGDLEVRCVIA
jgi:hypothetical protein